MIGKTICWLGLHEWRCIYWVPFISRTDGCKRCGVVRNRNPGLFWRARLLRALGR